jgi:hypothetical protein
MKRKCGVFFGFAVVLTAAIVILAGCELGTNSDTGGDTGRYETVSVSTASRAADGGNPGYVLVNSGYKGDTYYYLYYLGYVKNTPIAYRPSLYYDGTTPITITFEKSDVTEETITESTERTKEFTSTVHVGLKATVGAEAEGGVIFTKAKVTASIEAEVSHEWANMTSTSNTLETARMEAEGLTDGFSVTIGDHGEAEGSYRYALFSITDAYVLYEVPKGSADAQTATFTTCARANTYTWAMDFEPGKTPVFGKTGAGDLFEIPDIDFTTVDAPTEEMEDELEPPPPPSEFKNTPHWVLASLRTRAEKTNGVNGDIASKKNQTTSWELELTSMELQNQRADGTWGRLALNFTLIVSEGSFDWTVLKMTATQTVDLTNFKVTQMISTAPQKLNGSVTGERHGWINYIDTQGNEVITSLNLQLDGSGSDYNNLAIEAGINLWFVELNT